MGDRARIPKLETAEEIRRVLRATIRELKRGEMEPKRDNAIIYALKLAKELLEVGEFEERLRKLEETIKRLEAGGYEVKS